MLNVYIIPKLCVLVNPNSTAIQHIFLRPKTFYGKVVETGQSDWLAKRRRPQLSAVQTPLCPYEIISPQLGDKFARRLYFQSRLRRDLWGKVGLVEGEQAVHLRCQQVQ